ncbi:MAG: glutamine-hydrolyzing GMP synthase [Candidatus Cloacimonetes bacterium]|nr:glutamine-hydrolyzing GMP synthase [Candidatus Cloacimonadota bacterium]
MNKETVLILDFGSQYTQLIAKSTRKLGVYSEIVPYNTTLEEIKKTAPKALILSGSPYSVNQSNAPFPDKGILDMGIPILGICYGMQLLSQWFGGVVVKSTKKEYGFATIKINSSSPLFTGLDGIEKVWMSHGDSLTEPPINFEVIAQSENSPYAAIHHTSKPFYAIQFHPEVTHTFNGLKILDNFLKKISGFKGDWTPVSFITNSVAELQQLIGDDRVLLALSGGVDSSVTAALLDKAIGDRLTAVFVDTGLLRKAEAEEVQEIFSEHWHLNLITIDAKELFYERLKGVADPEEKRKIIGKTFIEVFETEAEKHQEIKYLAQGTLYPDVIESVSFKGPSATIKSHHNVGGLPKKMKLRVVEPLRELFKDEVRLVGKELGLPDSILQRHPFPGPGLAVRIPGDITPQKVSILQEIDYIFIEELKKNGLYHEVWQAFAVLLPVQSVGVMGDERTYEYVCSLRAVCSSDGMTADWAELPATFLKRVSNRIINEVTGVNRVLYDISSKPPSTIEWE